MIRNAFSVFVFGSYERFLPYYVYSIENNYPDTDILIFYNSELSKNVKDFLVSYPQVKLFENFYTEYSFFKKYKMKGGGGMTLLRYLIPSNYFAGYDNIYFGDVDIVILKENFNLFDFHTLQVEKSGVPFSNRVRLTEKNELSKRLTGLHFVNVKPYFTKMDAIINNILTNESYRERIINSVQRDEEFLYTINMEGFNFNPVEMAKNIVPLHGIHLGGFRHSKITPNNPISTPGNYVHKETVQRQLKQLMKDKVFLKILRNFYSIEMIRTLKYFEIKIPKLINIISSYHKTIKYLFN